MKNNSSAEEAGNKRSNQNKNKKRKKLFQISFPLCSKEIYPAYSKLEAKRLFLQDNRLILDKTQEKKIKIKEIRQEEFGRKHFEN